MTMIMMTKIANVLLLLQTKPSGFDNNNDEDTPLPPQKKKDMSRGNTWITLT